MKFMLVGMVVSALCLVLQLVFLIIKLDGAVSWAWSTVAIPGLCFILLPTLLFTIGFAIELKNA